MVNDPVEVRNAPEKLFVLRYRDFMPPTLITRDPVELAAFRSSHGDIILKPLYGNGGAGVFRLGEADQNFAALLELFVQTFREPFIAQRYLPEVRKGDKRIILVDGKVAGAINRVPAIPRTAPTCMWAASPSPPTSPNASRKSARRIGPDLKKRGLIFVGST